MSTLEAMMHQLAKSSVESNTRAGSLETALTQMVQTQTALQGQVATIGNSIEIIRKDCIAIRNKPELEAEGDRARARKDGGSAPISR